LEGSGKITSNGTTPVQPGCLIRNEKKQTKKRGGDEKERSQLQKVKNINRNKKQCKEERGDSWRSLTKIAGGEGPKRGAVCMQE